MDTIVPATLPQVAQFMKGLEDRGIGRNEVQRAIDDIVVLNGVAAAMSLPVDTGLDLDQEFNGAAMVRLVRYLFARYFDHQRLMERRQQQFPGEYAWISGVKPDMQLTKTVVMKTLMEGLSANHQAVFVLRSGLLEGRELSVVEVAEQLGLTNDQVARLRKQANEHVKKRARQLYAFGRWARKPAEQANEHWHSLTPESLIPTVGFQAKTLAVLLRGGFKTVGDLAAMSYSELLDVRNLTGVMADEISLILDAAGLRLRQD